MSVHRDRLYRLVLREEGGGAREDVRHVLDDEGVAKVGLVRAVVAHGVAVAYPAVGTLVHLLALAKLREHAREHLFHDGEDVVLGGKAHLGVQLIELAGAAVGACVLIAEAGRDLEISVKARSHQELLVLLRRLRQSVKLAGMQAGRHDEVARSLRGRTGEDGGGDLQKPEVGHLASEPAHHLGAEDDLVLHLGVAQVEEAVAQPRILSRLRAGRDLEGELLIAPAQHFHLFGLYLDHACGHVGIGRTAADDLALHRDGGLAGDGTHQRLHLLGGRHRLRAAVEVAQHEEDDRAEIARARKPSGKFDVLTYVALAELSASVCPEFHILSYSRWMPAASHFSLISSGHRLACTSPMCAFCSSSMHSLDCPMPPPMVSGSSPATISL